MSIYTSTTDSNNTHEYDEGIDETEDNLIENYLYLARRCGALRHSVTADALDSVKKEQCRPRNAAVFTRQFSLATECPTEKYEVGLHSTKVHSAWNDFNNNYSNGSSSSLNRIPPTIYYNISDDGDDADYSGQPFSLVKVFARMKARLKHDRRYKPDSTHQLLSEDDSSEWSELTKNTRQILTKALLPDGGYDAARNYRSTRSSQKKIRQSDPVLIDDVEEDNEKIHFDIDDIYGVEEDQECDESIWKNFLQCSRGFSYRRCAVCKAVDRQKFQGQLVYVYGVANNIIIDENLKASGLG